MHTYAKLIILGSFSARSLLTDISLELLLNAFHSLGFVLNLCPLVLSREWRKFRCDNTSSPCKNSQGDVVMR